MANKKKEPVVFTMTDPVIVKVKRGCRISEHLMGIFSGGQTFTTSRERAQQLAAKVDIIGPAKEVVEDVGKLGLDRMVHASMDREG